MPTTQRSARFEELVYEPDAHAELLGPGCTGAWTRVPCSAGLALGGGQLVFHYDGSKADLVRLSAHARRAYQARPEHVRLMLNGEELRRWPIPPMEGGKRIMLLPGDSLKLRL